MRKASYVLIFYIFFEPFTEVPEDICREVQLCTDECVAFDTWPVNPLPPKPTSWPIERRLEVVDYSEIRYIFAEVMKPLSSKSFWEAMVLGLSEISGRHTRSLQSKELTMDSDAPLVDCGTNIRYCLMIHSYSHHNFIYVSCHIYNFVEWSLPLQDADGDWFSVKDAKRFRGTDWRGYDCNDEVRIILHCFFAMRCNLLLLLFLLLTHVVHSSTMCTQAAKHHHMIHQSITTAMEFMVVMRQEVTKISFAPSTNRRVSSSLVIVQLHISTSPPNG